MHHGWGNHLKVAHFDTIAGTTVEGIFVDPAGVGNRVEGGYLSDIRGTDIVDLSLQDPD